jgi:hypothetical protein
VTKRKPTTESGQPARHADDDAARREAVALLRGDRGLTDNLRIDTIATLRLTLDHYHTRAQSGEKVDLASLLACEERLRSLLPPARAPADTKLAEHQRGQQALAPVIKFVRGLHEQISALTQENVTLRIAARSALAPAPAPVTPTEADVVPPSEQADRDFHIGGPKSGPDDPRPVTIEGKATAAPAADDGVDLRAGFDDGRPEPWRPFSHLYER